MTTSLVPERREFDVEQPACRSRTGRQGDQLPRQALARSWRGARCGHVVAVWRSCTSRCRMDRMDAVGEQDIPGGGRRMALGGQRLGFRSTAATRIADLFPVQGAFEQGVRWSAQRSRRLASCWRDVRGQVGGRRRGDGPVEKPEAQVQRPASEDHPGEGIGRVAAAPQLGSQQLAQRPERGPLLGRRSDAGGGSPERIHRAACRQSCSRWA